MSMYSPEDHTKINAHWYRLIAFAETRGRMGEASELRTILADARRETQSLVHAKAILLSMFYQAVTTAQGTDVAEIWTWPHYTRGIKAYAWHVSRRDGMDDAMFRELLEAAQLVKAIRDEARQKRRLKAEA